MSFIVVCDSVSLSFIVVCDSVKTVYFSRNWFLCPLLVSAGQYLCLLKIKIEKSVHGYTIAAYFCHRASSKLFLCTDIYVRILRFYIRLVICPFCCPVFWFVFQYFDLTFYYLTLGIFQFQYYIVSWCLSFVKHLIFRKCIFLARVGVYIYIWLFNGFSLSCKCFRFLLGVNSLIIYV